LKLSQIVVLNFGHFAF